jgi:hypothetical protein
MPIRKIHWQRIAVDGVGRDPSQRRFLSRDDLSTHGLDLQDQSLIRRQIQRLVRDDDLAIEMCAHGHDATSLFQYRRNADVFQDGAARRSVAFRQCTQPGQRNLCNESGSSPAGKIVSLRRLAGQMGGLRRILSSTVESRRFRIIPAWGRQLSERR